MARTSRNVGKNNWALFLLILLGIVAGSFIGHLTREIDFLSWLDNGIKFSFGDSDSKAATLDLAVIVIRFGIQIKVTVGSVIGAIASVFIYKKI